MPEKLLTITQLCELVQVSRSTVDRWRKKGLPCIKAGRSVRFEEKEAMAWIKNHSK